MFFDASINPKQQLNVMMSRQWNFDSTSPGKRPQSQYREREATRSVLLSITKSQLVT